MPPGRAGIAREHHFASFCPTAGYGGKSLLPSRSKSRKEVWHVDLEQQRHPISRGTRHQEWDSNAFRSTPRSVQDRRKQSSLPANQPYSFQVPLQHRRGSPLQTDRPRQRPPVEQHGERREQSHRSVPTRNKRDTDPMKPLALRTNHLGYVTWHDWDCRPWEPYQLWAYHMSRHYHLEKRTKKLLHLARSEAKRCPRDHEPFWYNYYARARFASESSRAFQFCLIETRAITTLLRTAPKVIYRRLASTIFPIDDMARELHRLLQELHELQRLRLNQVPLTYQPLETRGIISPQDLEQIESICDASPQLWTVEPMIVSVTLAIYRLFCVLEPLSEFRRTKGRFLPRGYVQRSEDLQRLIHHNIWELSELGHELKALRYYQLNKYLASPFLTSVIAGKRLWQQLTSLHQGEMVATQFGTSTLPAKAIAEDPPSFVRSATGKIMFINARGFFSFRRWTGEDWVIERHQYYTSSLSVIAAASAEAVYQAVAMRPRCAVPPRFREYLLSYYSGLKHANERLYPYMRCQANSSVIIFLLRTAPFNFSTGFDRTLEALDTSNYELLLKLEDLRRSHIMLACLPSSPLLFQSLVIRTVVNSAIVRSSFSRRIHAKLLRASYKAAGGAAWRGTRQTDYLKDSEKNMRLMFSKHQRSADWTRQYPCAVAEPLYNAVGRLFTMHAKLRDPLQNTRNIVSTFSGTMRWTHMANVFELLRKTVFELSELARYFTAMRYYRAQHFPGSISAGEMFVPDSLLSASFRAPSGYRRVAISRPSAGHETRIKTAKEKGAKRQIRRVPSAVMMSRKGAITRSQAGHEAQVETASKSGAKGRIRRVAVAVVMSRKPCWHERQIDLSQEDKITRVIPKARSRRNHASKRDERHGPGAPKERPLYTRSGRRV